MTEAVLYVRFSTPKQEHGSSKERQLQDGRAFIERMGWHEAEVVADLGVSAWKGDHLKSGNLGKFAKRLMDGEFPRGTVIVVEEIDRLSRQKARITKRWIEDICDAGYQIATVKGDRIYNAANLDANLLPILEILLKAEAAHDYVERLSHRVKRSYDTRLTKAREDGSPITTVAPMWLRLVDGKRWEGITERTRIVREIYELAAAGHSPWSIARAFNERGEKSFRGGKWERTAVVKILNHRAVEGDRVVGEGKASKPTGEVLIGYYGEPVVPADLVADARAMLERRTRTPSRGIGQVNNLFGHKLQCGACGGRVMQVGYQSRYLVCYDASRGGGCSHKSAFKYRPLEKAALDDILHLALDETFFRQAERSNSLSLEIAEVDKAIRDKTAEAGRLVDLLSRIASPTTEAKLGEIERYIATLNSKLADLKVTRAEAQGAAGAEAHLARVHDVREAMSHADDEVRLPARLKVAEALQTIIQHIACETDGQGNKQFEMVLMSGAYAARYSNDGVKLGEVRGNLETVAIEAEGSADDLVRRMRGRKKRSA